MSQKIEIQISNFQELSQVVDFLYPYLKPQTLFLFYGEMASGKTTLISNLLQKINILQVSSPTYAIHQLYKVDTIDIHHFDLHRLESADDIESTGFWDFFNKKNSIFFIEWADYISKDQWPMDFKIIKINIYKKSENSRRFEIFY
jgi:tRNA threonylcarbamoyladenosine biosynthesis protein TsaE